MCFISGIGQYIVSVWIGDKDGKKCWRVFLKKKNIMFYVFIKIHM